MKRSVIGISFGLLAIVGAVVAAPNQTRAVDIVTDEQIAQVRSRCTEIQATLNRLEASDRLLRHNIANTFLIVSDKLMVPLNQRIASNQLDGSKLLTITASYTKAYKGDLESSFYSTYAEYENSLLATMKIDCVKQPTTFIDALDIARKNRLKLRVATERLMKLAGEYKTEFDTFQTVRAKQEVKR